MTDDVLMTEIIRLRAWRRIDEDHAEQARDAQLQIEGALAQLAILMQLIDRPDIAYAVREQVGSIAAATKRLSSNLTVIMWPAAHDALQQAQTGGAG